MSAVMQSKAADGCVPRDGPLMADATLSGPSRVTPLLHVVPHVPTYVGVVCLCATTRMHFSTMRVVRLSTGTLMLMANACIQFVSRIP